MAFLKMMKKNHMFGIMAKNKWYTNMDERVKLLESKQNAFVGFERLVRYTY